LANTENDTGKTIGPTDWVRTIGGGLLAGAAFVAVAMLVENRAIKLGAKWIGR
jgi:hypothetical protein